MQAAPGGAGTGAGAGAAATGAAGSATLGPCCLRQAGRTRPAMWWPAMQPTSRTDATPHENVSRHALFAQDSQLIGRQHFTQLRTLQQIGASRIEASPRRVAWSVRGAADEGCRRESPAWRRRGLRAPGPPGRGDDLPGADAAMPMPSPRPMPRAAAVAHRRGPVALIRAASAQPRPAATKRGSSGVGCRRAVEMRDRPQQEPSQRSCRAHQRRHAGHDGLRQPPRAATTPEECRVRLACAPVERPSGRRFCLERKVQVHRICGRRCTERSVAHRLRVRA